MDRAQRRESGVEEAPLGCAESVLHGRPLLPGIAEKYARWVAPGMFSGRSELLRLLWLAVDQPVKLLQPPFELFVRREGSAYFTRP